MTMPKASADANAKPLSIVNWYIVGVLTLAYLFSYIDRQILSLMVGPIRRDLDITDTEFSLLHGLAFAVFYTLLGIPLARLADRANRRNIMAGGVAFWSVATMCCGLASNFLQLFSARIAVGVGEAALSPAAYSTLADLFPRNKLGRAISIYSSGVFLGIGLSLVIGGALIAALEASGGITLPVLGHLESWQAAFMAVGLPGFLVSLLFFTFREPMRTNAIAASGVSLAEIKSWARKHWRLYLGHFVGFAMTTLLFNAIMAWAAEYFIRIHGSDRAEIGAALGLITALFGGVGIIAGGLYCDHLAAKGRMAAPIQAGLVGVACLTPFAIAAPLAPDANIALALFCPLLFFASFPFGPAAAGLQIVTPPSMRAQFSAVYLLFVNLTGIGFGGTATALATDYIFKDDMKLHWSMASIALAGGLLSVIILAASIPAFRKGHKEILEGVYAAAD